MLKLREVLCKNQQQELEGQHQVELIRLMLEEVRVHSHEITQSGNVLDAKIMSLLMVNGWIVLAASLFLQSFSLDSPLLRAWVIGLFIAYGVTIVVVLIGQRPQDYSTPVPAKWESVEEYFLQVPEEDALKTLISTYIEMMREDSDINTRKAKLYSKLLWCWSLLIAVVSPIVLWLSFVGGR